MHAIYAIICAAFLTFFFVRICPPRPDPPICPKYSWKHFLAAIFAIIGAIIYFQLCQIGFGSFTEPVHFINANIAGLAVGAGMCSIWCPF